MMLRYSRSNKAAIKSRKPMMIESFSFLSFMPISLMNADPGSIPQLRTEKNQWHLKCQPC